MAVDTRSAQRHCLTLGTWSQAVSSVDQMHLDRSSACSLRSAEVEPEAAEIGVRAAALGQLRELVADVQDASQQLGGATQCDRFE